jgi:hypothetical protein
MLIGKDSPLMRYSAASFMIHTEHNLKMNLTEKTVLDKKKL